MGKGKNYPQSEEEMIATLEAKKQTRVYNKNKDVVSRSENISNLLRNKIVEFKADTARDKIDLEDTESVKKQAFTYLSVCEETGVLPDMQGLALALGRTSRSVEQWRKNKAETPTGEFLEMCGDMFSSLITAAANNGDINNIFAIFTQKAKHGWRETSEIIVTPNNQLGEVKDRAELQKITEAYVLDVPEE